MAITLSAPKREGKELSQEQLDNSRPKPFPVSFEFDGIEWEVWIDLLRVSPGLANEFVIQYSKSMLASGENEDMKREILAMAQQLKATGHVEGAQTPPKAARRGKSKVEVAEPEPKITAEQIEAIASITEEIQFKSSQYTLANMVSTGAHQTELYEAECHVVAAAIVRLDEAGEPAAFGAPALNYPDFDPTYENLFLTGQIGPTLVKAVMGQFHPTSAASRQVTRATGEASSTDSENGLKPAETQEATPTNTAS